jgi:FMN-dependent NADH-azoreductase
LSGGYRGHPECLGEKLPEFDQEAIGAKYKGINQEPMDEAEQKAGDRIQELVARFK